MRPSEVRLDPPTRVDPDDDEAFAALYAVRVAAVEHDDPQTPDDPPEDVRGALRSTAHEDVRAWLWSVDGEPVAMASAYLPLQDNRHLVEVDHLRVTPAWRRRGVGQQVLAFVLEHARQVGRTVVAAQSCRDHGSDTPSAGDLFAGAAGAEPALVEVRRTQHLDELDWSALARLEQEASAASAGYRLVQWVDRAPDDLVAGVATLLGRMVTDAPMGELDLEPEHYDVERVRSEERQAQDRGRLRVAAALVHDRTGVVAGYSDMGISRSRPAVGYQWETIVLPEHRGHRLGLRLKLANTRALRDASPATRRVHTWNAASNEHMIRINEAVGFRPTQVWTQWQLRLPAPE
ncbi:MAG: GNAT family N-acetyltransferase [Actinomycetes bacterium]